MTAEEFDRQKIYEKLDYQAEPSGYSSPVPWVIQQQIAATNGIHYANSIGKLGEIPIPSSPLPTANSGQSLCLDIGCGWGRWLVAIGRKGYVPIGIDIRHEFCTTARQTLKLHQLNGYTVVADLKNLPFKDGVLDAVWSFSVIQHTHRERLKSCIQHIHRVLRSNGFCFLEFPNKYGVHNYLGPYPKAKLEAENYNSWDVRYYSLQEYKAFFLKHFSNFKAIVHSMLGIGVLPNDLKYTTGLKNRLQIGISLTLTEIAKVIKPLVHIADSFYVVCHKQTPNHSNDSIAASVDAFWNAHLSNPEHNLNIIPLLQCPVTGGELRLEGEKLISNLGQIAYPVIDGIPILVASEAIKIS